MNGLELTINTAGVITLADSFGATAKQTRRAEVRALNKTMRWVLKNVVKQVGKEAKLPAKLIRQRIHVFKASAKKRSARIWAGLDPIPAHRLGKVKQLKRGGARAGRHTFRNAFVVGSISGKPVIFQRTGEAKRLTRKGRYAGTNIKREPLQVPKLALDTVSIRGVIDEWFGKANKRFLELFAAELRYEVFVKHA
nr:hypothetical protein 11 [Gammaproteobacteria bacterium]